MKKWKNITKRIVALGLAAVLIANSVPVTALADSETMSFADLQTLIDSAADGGTVKLDRDYTAGDSDTALVVPADQTVTLDLNDHYILYKGTESAPVITVNGSLTLMDSKTQKTKRYVTLTDGRATGVSDSGTPGADCIEVTGGFIAGGNYENNQGGGVYVNDGCMFTMEGGTIAGCKSYYGGGVFVNNSGTFTMNGGSVANCTVNSGGGVFVNNGGTFTMNGGSIANCTATNSSNTQGGGGVFVHGGGAFTMEGGSITNCTVSATGYDTYGGGVFVFSSGVFTMEGGSITNCTANTGGGVYLSSNKFKVSGAPVISGNKKGIDANNVAFNGSKTITVTGALTDGAEIRVNASNGYTVAVPGTPSGGTTAYTITDTDAACFHSDLGAFTGGVDSDGNVVFKAALPTATLSNPSMVYNGSAFSPTISFGGEALTKDEDYTLSYKKVVDTQETSLSGAPKDAGSYKLVIAGKGSYAGIQELDFTITKKTVTVVSGITVKDKEYDGGTTAELITTGAVFEGKCNGDTLTVSATGAGTFADKDAGASKAVSIDATEFVLGGASAGNYVLAGNGHQDSATATISKKSITITGVTANDKEYDGNTTATTVTSAATVTGLVGTDTVAFTVDGAFADANKGNNKTVTLSNWNLTSGDTNYEIDAANSQTTTTASITGVQVYIAGVSAQNKTYDGNKSATVTGTAILKKVNGNTVSGLTVSDITAEFEDKNADDNKSVTITGGILSDPDNYILVPGATSGLTADITPASVTITGFSANNKIYDGTTYATVTGTPVVNGKIGNDAVMVSAGTAAFDNANVGTDKTVTISNMTLTGEDASNYALSGQQITVSANITAKPLAGTVTISGGSHAGIQVGDTLTATLTPTLTPTNTSVSYQWLIDGVASEGATSSIFLIPDGTAAGSNISVRVTGSGNYTGTLTSSAVEMGKKSVGDATVSIDGTASVGETLTAMVNVGTSEMTASDYSLVWCRDGANFTGATLASYTIVGADRGHTISVKLIAKGDYSGEIVSNGKTIPAGTPMVSVNATAGNAQATVTWNVDAAGQVINQYQVTCVETNEVIMLSPDVSSYTFTGLTNGTAYSFNVKAVYGSSSVESTAVSATPTAPSNPGGGTGGGSGGSGSGGGSTPATSPAPSAAPGESPSPSAEPGTSPAPTIVEQKTETTNNPDGTTTTTTTTLDSEGTKTTEAETVLTDGSVEKITDVVKSDGSTEKVVETEHPDGSSEKTVDIVNADGSTETISEKVKPNGASEKVTDIEKADGTTIHEDVKTTAKGKETSYRSETLPTGDKTVTEQMKQPSGDFSKTTTKTTLKKDDEGNVIDTSVKITVEVKTGAATTRTSFSVISSEPVAKKNALGSIAKLAGKKKNQVALTKATTNAKLRTVTITKTVKADGVTYKVVTLKKGMLKGNKKKPTKVKFQATGVTKVEKGAFKAMAKKGTIYVSGTKKQFKKLKKLIVKSGLPKGVKIKRV